MTSFVGRQAEVRALVEAVRSSRGGPVGVVGAYGLGKSVLLLRLADLVRDAVPDAFVLPVTASSDGGFDASAYATGVPSGPDPTSMSSDELRLRFDRSVGLLRALLAGLPQDDVAVFVAATERARAQANQASLQVHNSVQATGWRSSISQADLSVDVADADAYLRNTLRGAQDLVDDAFVETWNRWSARWRVLLAVDGFEGLSDDLLGTWFLPLVERLQHALVVLPLTPTGLARLTRPWSSHRLASFTSSEVAAYLTAELGGEPDAAVVAGVHEFTGGHPKALQLTTELVRQHGGAAVRPSAVRDLLATLPQPDAQGIDDLVHAIAGPAAQGDDDLWRAVTAAAVTRRVDAALLTDLLAPDGVTDVGPLLRTAVSLGLLDVSGEGSYRMHEFVRRALSERVRSDPGRWEALHERAAEHHYAQLLDGEDRLSDDVFGSWYKYEDPDWQWRMQELLHHSNHVRGRRALARSRFVVVFLEAFWWWGCFVEFPFCTQLLDTWERSARDDDDRALAEQLRRVLDSYAPGSDKPPGPHWTAVRRALLRVQDLCGLGRAWREEDDLRRRALGLSEIFLAHTRWYDDQLDAADALYERCLATFAELDDPWVLSWLWFERADVAVERGDLEAARRCCEQSAERVHELGRSEQEVDEELVSNLHRCTGDLLWPADPRAAAWQYGAAVRHSYLSQRMANPLSLSRSAPDEYTAQHYRDVVRYVADRLAQGPDDVAAAAAEGFGSPPQAPVTVATPEALAAALFPPGPGVDELHRTSSPFCDEWCEFVHEHPSDALEDLAALLRVLGTAPRHGSGPTDDVTPAATAGP